MPLDEGLRTWLHHQAKDMQRLHPQSWRDLRQLVKLHGARAIMRAVQYIEHDMEHGEDDS